MRTKRISGKEDNFFSLTNNTIMKQKFNYSLMMTLFLAVVSAVFGVVDAGAYGLADPVVTDIEGGGKTITQNEGGMTLEAGKGAVEEMYLSDIDKRITKMRPMATPIDQISRHGESKDARSMVVKYYSVGSRSIKTTTTEAITETAKDRASLKVADASMFDVADTIRVVGVKGFKTDKTTQDPKVDLMLRVAGMDTDGNPIVHAINGKKIIGADNTIPAIPSGTTVIRMGRACSELDAQTGVFSNIPTPETQFCQNFMMQIEQSTFDEMSDKEVDWGFSDLEEDAVYEMRMGAENSFLFGVKGLTKDPIGKKEIYTTGGIYYMPSKDIEVGAADDSGNVVIKDTELVDIAKDLFTGTGVGNKRKIAFMGSDILAAFAKIQTDKFKMKENVEKWGLKFKSFDTDFGEVLAIHHELFDLNGKPDEALVIDPSYLTKKTFLKWSRRELDLKESGQRNTTAVVLQEASCLYLRYPKAHARLKLVAAE